MAEGLHTQTPHLRVQLTLTGTRRSPTSGRAGEFHSQLRVATQNFPCEIHPEEPLSPGGAAVHCMVTFTDRAAALPHFPPGSIFELWEGGRRGYGMVLAVLAAA